MHIRLDQIRLDLLTRIRDLMRAHQARPQRHSQTTATQNSTQLHLKTALQKTAQHNSQEMCFTLTCYLSMYNSHALPHYTLQPNSGINHCHSHFLLYHHNTQLTSSCTALEHLTAVGHALVHARPLRCAH